MLNGLVKTSIALLFSAIAVSNVAASQAIDKENTRYIVKFKPQARSLMASTSAISTLLGVKVQKSQAMAAGLTLVTIPNTHSVVQQANILKQLKQNKWLDYATVDKKSYIKPMSAITTPANYTLSHDLQWDQFKAPGGVMLESAAGLQDGAWQFSLGEATQPVVVAVLDTGLELNERLTNNLLLDSNKQVIGWNFAGNNSDLSDETGGFHGTHVAGTIAASGQDLLGMGPKLKLLPIKIPDSSGMFYESAVINGIYWALGEHVPGVADNPYPAKVMNMSFGIDEGPGKEVEDCDQILQEAIDFAGQKDAAIVVAAGNNNQEHDLGAPAGCKGTIRVSSTGPTGNRAYYSNYGEGITYAAPGGDKHMGANGAILSTVKPGTGIEGSGLDYKQGTSMASPHVAGLFGLVFAYGQQYDLTLPQVKQIIYSTTHAFGDSNDQDNACKGAKACGHGIIDADNALAAVAADYRFIINAPTTDLLKLTSTGCQDGKVKAQASHINTPYGEWKLLKNACVSKADLDLPTLKRVDFSVTANYGKLQYKIFPQGHCQVIGIDGLGCH